jgi:acetolactate synthase-1/2/3 large subunit
MSRHTTAHYFLEGLVDLGVDYIFANLGTDHVSLIEEMARWDKERRKHPDIILCPHEVVAVHMAGGYALATGRGQAVLVHVDAGTANAAMAIQNLFRYRLPVMLKPLGIESVGNTSEEFSKILAADIARWAEVAKAANIKMEQ